VIHALAWIVQTFSRLWDKWADRFVVDGSINAVARRTWDVGLALRNVQTGQLRQYVMFIVVGTVALFVLISFVWSVAVAG
jgi:NADH-quinone oxidoreductase subunit L